MTLVDSSVWIDYFRGVTTPRTDRFDRLLGRRSLMTGDLVVTEVLQGFHSEREFETARRLLMSVEFVEIGGKEIAVQAAINFRKLRKLGVTVRKSIDTLIATRCIVSGYELLHSDRGFEPFVKHLGLREA